MSKGLKNNKLRICKEISALLMIVTLLLSSCIETASQGGRRGKVLDKIGVKDPTAGLGGDGSGKGAGAGTGTETAVTGTLSQGLSELRHIIDPATGTYKTKVTLPKNYSGLLFIAGLNITSLNDRIVYVNFNFGTEYTPVRVQATISRAPGGITPDTDIELLTLDMSSKPFEKLRLHYKLYDYNNYRDTSGNETKEPTQDPLNAGLFCRGLKLEHDPTFEGSQTNNRCDVEGERCLYTFADVIDQGLVDSSNIPGVPTQAAQDNIPEDGFGYGPESAEFRTNSIKKCLPDSSEKTILADTLNVNLGGAGTMSLGTIIPIDLDSTGPNAAENFTYEGPFRLINTTLWELGINDPVVLSPMGQVATGGSCLTDYQCASNCCLRDGGTCAASRSGDFDPLCDGRGPTGLFKSSYNKIGAGGASLAEGGFGSFMFPRSGKKNFGAGIDYFGSTTPFDTRTLQTMTSNDESDYMDGCNIRATTTDDFSKENIASCNVSATIELVVKNAQGKFVPLEGTTTTDLKLQLVRSSKKDFFGNEVIASSFSNCENSNGCGAGECCFNKRCWSKDLVGQCIEDNTDEVNLGVGDSCNSDYQCASLCCDSATSSCAVHKISQTGDPSVLCSKPAGQSCVSSMYCQKIPVKKCFIVKQNIAQPGDLPCAKMCLMVPTLGDCRNNVCVAPVTPAEPAEPDPEDANACVNAIDLSELPNIEE